MALTFIIQGYGYYIFCPSIALGNSSCCFSAQCHQVVLSMYASIKRKTFTFFHEDEDEKSSTKNKITTSTISWYTQTLEKKTNRMGLGTLKNF
jgi:hypothetical protein